MATPAETEEEIVEQACRNAGPDQAPQFDFVSQNAAPQPSPKCVPLHTSPLD